MMIDSGSSTMAYCDPPNPDFVTDIQRIQIFDESNQARNLSQCIRYGTGTHGWYGETYTGTIETNGVKTTGHTFAIMNKSVGLIGNQCGPVLEGSIGIENSTDAVRGIMGIGRDDKFSYEDMIVGESWTDGAIEMGQCLEMECECPTPIAWGFNSSFLSYLNQFDIYQFAITWDGSLGKHSGKLLYNEYAEKDILELMPKVPIEMDPLRSRRLWSTNVTSIGWNGVILNTATTHYFFDTGSGYISLPEQIYNIVNSTDQPAIIDFYVPTIDWELGNVTSFNVTVTRDLLDARVFRKGHDGGPFFFGLNVYRYLDNIMINFNSTQAYFRANIREHILDLPADLPLTRLAGSKSNETQELKIVDETTGEVNVNTTNFVSEFITNSTGGENPDSPSPTAAAHRWATGSSIKAILAYLVVVATSVMGWW